MSDATYTPYSGLGSLLRRNGHLLGTTEQDREAAECAAFSLASGLGAIGKMLVHCDAQQLAPADWNTLGDLLVTASEGIGEFLNIAAERTQGHIDEARDAPGKAAEAPPATA